MFTISSAIPPMSRKKPCVNPGFPILSSCSCMSQTKIERVLRAIGLLSRALEECTVTGKSISVPFSEIDTHGRLEVATGSEICLVSSEDRLPGLPRGGFSDYTTFVLLNLVGARHCERQFLAQAKLSQPISSFLRIILSRMPCTQEHSDVSSCIHKDPA